VKPRVLLLLVCAALLGAPLAIPAYSAPLDFVGAYDPGTPGLNASAVGLDGVAYVGSWGSSRSCPGLGVRVVDVRDPAAPTPLGVAAAYPRTTAEHLAALRLDTPAFAGNLLLAGIQRCAPSAAEEGGLAAWDVTDPANPRELSFFPVGQGPRGVHEFAAGQLGGRWYAYLAVPNSELFDGRGDLRIVDVTDPTSPVEVADWGARRDAGLPVGFGGQCEPHCRGRIPQAFLHSVALSPDGRTAYLSYWDLGVVLLDVSDPTSPRLLGRFAEPMAAEGNTHSVSIAHGGSLALVADETFAPPWGRLRLVDVRDPANPVQVGTYDTPNSAADTPGGPEVWYGIHNPLVDDRDPSRAYLAWYADGVRLVDVSDASAPVELANWVPPRDPLVWSVATMDDLLLVGDVNGGLYILRR
jgi:hypothetical protein